MDTFTAIDIIEGDTPLDEDDTLAAWQHLVDTGIVWSLQGSYGRQASRMLDAGLLHHAGAGEN